MNKKTLRIAGWALGLSMAVAGIGVALDNGTRLIETSASAIDYIKTNLSDLKTGDVGVLVGNNGSNYALSNNKGTSSAPAAVSVTVANDKLSSDPAATLLWSVTKDGGNLQFNVPETENYLYCTNANNGVRVGDSANNIFTIDDEGYLINSATSRYVGIYNSSDWRCYTSVNANISGQEFYFYKKVETDRTLTGIEISGTYQTTFEKDEAFNYDGMTVTASYDNGDSKDVTADATFTGHNTSKTGVQTVTVSYDEGGDPVTTTYNITVAQATGVTLNGDMSKKSYHNGDDWDVSGLSLTITWSDGEPTVVQLSDLTKGADYSFDKGTASEGDTTLTITGTYKGFDFSKTVTGITVSAAPDVLNRAFTTVTGTSYSDWSGKTGSGGNGVVYAGNTAGGNDSIQMRTSGSSGIWTTASGKIFDGIEVTWNSNTADARSIEVYGKNTPYAKDDLYNDSTKGALIGSIANGTSVLTGDLGNYQYIGIIAAGGALWLDEINIFWAPAPELSSVTTSGQTASFAQGDPFAYDGTLTAHYTLGKSDETVEPTSFKIGNVDTDPSLAGAEITLGTTLNVTTHDGKYIYVGYTEGGITKWTSGYQITVNYASVTGVELDSYEGTISLGETLVLSELNPCVKPLNAEQGYTWTLHDDGGLTETEDYEFDGNEYHGISEGVVVLRCTSNANGSKYADYTLTITGNPIVTLPGSVSLYTGKNVNVTATVEGGKPSYSYAWSITSGNAYASITDGANSATVALNGISAGSVTLQCVVTDSLSKSTTESITFSVIESGVIAVDWDASNFDVFSGATIPADIDDTWMVNYTKNNGDSDYLTFGQYKLYLGDEEIESLPYTFKAADDGKKLHVEYESVSSSLIDVAVTQTINSVTAAMTAEWNHTIAAKAWSSSGSQNLNGKNWTMSGTGGSYFGYDNTKGQQFGSGSNPYSALTLTSDDFGQIIDSIDVFTSGASGISATVQASVGGTAYGDAKTISSSNSKYTFDLGGRSGQISIHWANNSAKAIYLKQIVVKYVSGTESIANLASHKAAQKVAVKFANAFNVAMDSTSNCTTNMSSAWSAASSAFEIFETEAAALGAAEEAYARNLIKYATVVDEWPDSFGDEGCIERMVKVYKTCVESHGMTAFMSAVRPDISAVARIPSPGFAGINNDDGFSVGIAIVAAGLIAAGGIFLISRKRRSED